MPADRLPYPLIRRSVGCGFATKAAKLGTNCRIGTDSTTQRGRSSREQLPMRHLATYLLLSTLPLLLAATTKAANIVHKITIQIERYFWPPPRRPLTHWHAGNRFKLSKISARPH